MEHPFTQLKPLASDRPSLPKLTSLVLAPSSNNDDVQDWTNRRMDHDDTGYTCSTGPVALPVEVIGRMVETDQSMSTTLSQIGFSSKNIPQKRFRHWNISRSSNIRSRREADDVDDLIPKRRKFPETDDYGVYTTLAGHVAVEGGEPSGDFEAVLCSGERQKSLLRSSLQVPHTIAESKSKSEYSVDTLSLDAEEYVRRLVYGGTDGLAYIRSLAEFVCNSKDNVSNGMCCSEIEELTRIVGDECEWWLSECIEGAIT